MESEVLYTIATLSGTGILAAVILYFVAQRFQVHEDPRIDKVEEALPGANCGGCGYPGCRPFAEACVKADTLDDLYCPVGGNDCMKEVASILGKSAAEKDPMVAVVRCAGSPQYRKPTSNYDGTPKCVISSSLYSGETACQYGCLGFGDCVEACDFDAIHMDPNTHLPVVIDDNCTACNACVEACPNDIIELRPKNKKDRKIFVSCVNHDKGGIAKKACAVACIGCQKCVKECPFDAITMDNFLAYIDPNKCKLCRKCVEVCPTNSIWEVNFPVKKKKKNSTSKNLETKKSAKKGNKEEIKIENKVTGETKKSIEKETTPKPKNKDKQSTGEKGDWVSMKNPEKDKKNNSSDNKQK